MQRKIFIALGVLLGTLLFAAIADAQGPTPRAPRANAGTAFTYQGKLNDGGSPANGVYDFKFTLWNYSNLNFGVPIGSPVLANDVTVTNGLFTVPLDFGGGAFNGDARWLEIQVRPGASTGAYTALTPWQELTPAPYALALPGLYTQQNATSPNLIGGYNGNTVTSSVYGATISGGGTAASTNRVTDHYGTVSGGHDNQAGDNAGTIGDKSSATVGGGLGNTASGYAATIGGGWSNTASGHGAFIGGGGYDGSSTSGNTASGNASVIGGGITNGASGTYAAIAGGSTNEASGNYTFIGGGNGNYAANSYSAVVGGMANGASGQYSFIGGGAFNTASGNYSTIPGGDSNSATISYTLAAGRRAKANHQGAFVWGDSTDADFASSANNQFLIRASGGAGIGTTSPAAMLHVSSNGGNTMPQMRLSNTAAGDYVRLRLTNDNTSATDGYNNRWDIGTISTTFSIYSGKVNDNIFTLTPSGANYLAMGNGATLTPGGTWTNASDRNVKSNFAVVDGRAALERLSTVPIQTWSYKAEDATVRHIGPMAQDFYAAFRVGGDDLHIATVDADGVALAAIQGLYEIVQEQEKEIAALRAQNAKIEARLDALEQHTHGETFPLNGLIIGALILIGAVQTLKVLKTFRVSQDSKEKTQ